MGTFIQDFNRPPWLSDTPRMKM